MVSRETEVRQHPEIVAALKKILRRHQNAPEAGPVWVYNEERIGC